MFAEAVSEARQARDFSGGSSHAIAFGSYALAKSGKKAEARKTLDDLTIQSRQHWVSPYARAVIHLALDEKEEALRLLEKSLDERAIFLQGDYGSLTQHGRRRSGVGMHQQGRFSVQLLRACKDVNWFEMVCGVERPSRLP